MRFSMRPERVYDGYEQIRGEELARRGIRLLLCDLDYTLAPKSQREPDETVRQWINSMRGGLLLVSGTDCPAPPQPEALARDILRECLHRQYTGVVLEPVLPRPAVAADAQLRTQLDLPPQGISVIEQDEVRHALLLIGEIPSGSFAINNNAYCGSCVRPRTSCGA